MALFGELLSNLNIPLGDAEKPALDLGDCIIFTTWETFLVGHSFLSITMLEFKSNLSSGPPHVTPMQDS